MKEITLHQFTCLRCGHKWHPRKVAIPITCPSCRSAYWDAPFKATNGDEAKKLIYYAHGQGGE